MSDFKSQLEAFVNEAAVQNWNKNDLDSKAFKQGCEFLIPVLMRAIEQRHDAYFETDSTYTQLESSFNKDLLNILKGEGQWATETKYHYLIKIRTEKLKI